MPYAPNIKIYSGASTPDAESPHPDPPNPEPIEQLFDPPEFFAFLKTLGYARRYLDDDQPDPRAKQIIAIFHEMLAMIRKDPENQLAETFAWYCQTCASSGKFLAALDPAQGAAWQANPEDFNPDARDLCIYFFQIKTELNDKSYAGVMVKIFAVFRGVAQGLEPLLRAAAKTEPPEFFEKKCTAEMCALTIAKIDTITDYLNDVEVGKTYRFSS